MWPYDDISLAVWAAYGGARSLGLVLDDDPSAVIDRMRCHGYTWEQSVAEIGFATPPDRRLAVAAAFAGIARWATARRDQAIREAREAGAPLRPLGDATGLSHEAVNRIAAR